MRKVFLMIIFIIFSTAAYSTTITLYFNAVKLNDLSFADIEEPQFDHISGDRTNMESGRNRYEFFIHGDDTAYIDLRLPRQNKYIYNIPAEGDEERTRCIFTDEELILMKGDRVVINFGESGINIKEDDNSNIKVGGDAIQVVNREEGEFIRLDDSGIIISDSEETQVMTGFWGGLLGRMIMSTVSTVMENVSENQGTDKMVIEIINNDNRGRVNINIE